MDDLTGGKNQYNPSDDPYGIAGLDSWDDFGMPSSTPTNPLGQNNQPISTIGNNGNNNLQKTPTQQATPLMPSQNTASGVGGNGTSNLNTQPISSGGTMPNNSNSQPVGTLSPIQNNPNLGNNISNTQYNTVGNSYNNSTLQTTGLNTMQNGTNQSSNNGVSMGSINANGLGSNSNQLNNQQGLNNQNTNANQSPINNISNSLPNQSGQINPTQPVSSSFQSQGSAGLTGASLSSTTLSDSLDDKDNLQSASSGMTPEVASSSDAFKVEQSLEASQELQEKSEVEKKIEAVNENLNKQKTAVSAQTQPKQEEKKETVQTAKDEEYPNLYGYPIPKNFSNNDDSKTKDLTDGAYWLHILIKRLQLMRMTQS